MTALPEKRSLVPFVRENASLLILPPIYVPPSIDEVGTPFCVTVDFDSLDDQTVTVRDRDTWEQDRVSVDKLKEYLQDRLD